MVGVGHAPQTASTQQNTSPFFLLPVGPTPTEQEEPLARVGVGHLTLQMRIWRSLKEEWIVTWGPSDRALKTAPPLNSQVRLIICDFWLCARVQRALLWPERESGHDQGP